MSGVKGAGNAAGDKAGSEKKYERSGIKFPYGDLDDAVEVARAIHDNAGTSCSTDQLAAYLKQSASSGAFRLKVATSAIFGLVENASGSNSLTELGRQIVDPNHAPKAKASAFMAVPLYSAIYEKYKGHMLPPAAALEREMAALGVSHKQTGKARQAFERSAQQAGYFAHGKDRLVAPAGQVVPPTKKVEQAGEKKHQQTGGGGSGGGDGSDLHPFIQGLLQSLPKPGEDWDSQSQAQWLKTAAHIFGLIYKSSEPLNISITSSTSGKEA